MDERELEKIEEVFERHIGILSEDFQHKLDIVAEGHQILCEKMDRVDLRLERVEERLDKVETKLDAVEARLSKKIDAVAADLTAHRADTEIHRARYQIREDPNS